MLAALPFGPFASKDHPVTREASFAQPAAAARDPETFFRLSFEFYRRVVSPMDGATCMHRPTCSLYGLQAVRRHGLVGFWLTVDRLLRGKDSSAVRSLRLLQDGDHLRLDDPLEESTFWFPRSQ